MPLSLTNKKITLIGFSAALLLLILYFGVLSLAESFSHAIEQFLQMWYWILILVVGFGIQVGLYSFIRESQKEISGGMVATSGGISTGSMIACCLHHLVDVLPLMGLAAAAVFLTQYQLWFIFLGILSNFVGIVIMLEIIQKHNLAGNLLNRILIYNMSRIKKVAIGSSLTLLLISFFWINNTQAPLAASTAVGAAKTKAAEKLNLSSQIDSQGGISFEVTPLNFNINDPLKFEIKVDTHSGSLDFDLTKVATVEDDLGNSYQALGWQGSGPGGHHLSGALIFSQINNQTQKIRLTIKDNYLRIFEWDLNLK